MCYTGGIMSRGSMYQIRTLCHPRLPEGVEWQGCGAEALLDAPAFVSVIVSRRCTADEIEVETCRIIEAVRRGAVAVGGFISVGEQLIARALSEVPGAKLIRLVPYPLRFYYPSRAGRVRIAEGTTLLLSGFMQGDGARTRERCLQSNAWARAIEAVAPWTDLPTGDVSAPEAPAPEGLVYAPIGDPGAVFL